jgi:hypothetical protein
VKEGTGVSNNFILQHVVPLICTRFSDEVALVLGKALLWLVFSEENSYVPGEVSERIHNAYSVIRQLLENVNPIEKLLMVVTGDDAEVYFNEVGRAAGRGDAADGYWCWIWAISKGPVGINAVRLSIDLVHVDRKEYLR